MTRSGFPLLVPVLALTLALAAAAIGTAWAVESAAGRKDPAKAITSQLICPCSCGEILSGCVCETGKTMQGFVSDELKAGKNGEQITASLVSKYGEVILGAPKAEGFNLIVWVAPFLATLVGFVIAAFVLRRWVRRRSDLALAGAGSMPGAGGTGGVTVPGTRQAAAEQDLAAYRARAEEELRRLEE
ncbi:MAG TPA: cytochrome c-type biogenesis protein CcmH [Candidatus Eisenbacteria bacterium]|nr:cytochrome c-type biogenesis protein CcmH [Candidatus Eisenbacteria bacterium]